MWVGYFDYQYVTLLQSFLDEHGITFEIVNNVVYLDIPDSRRPFIINMRTELQEKWGCLSKFYRVRV